jgi:hypothetical protein
MKATSLQCLVLAALASGCVTSHLAENRHAAAVLLSCPENEVLPTTTGQRYFEGCGHEAECMNGLCRAHRSSREVAATVAAAFEAQFSCPAAQQTLTPRTTDYVAQGCGRNATCSLDGHCREYLDRAAQLTHARAAFAREMSCPNAEISVVPTAEGYRADGCDRAANCATYDGPCIAIHLPSCSEVAQSRYEVCNGQAHNDGKDARGSSWNTRMRLAESIEGTIVESQATQTCRSIYNEELSRCTARQASQH